MHFFPKAVLPCSLSASDSLIWASVGAIVRAPNESNGGYRCRGEDDPRGGSSGSLCLVYVDEL